MSDATGATKYVDYVLTVCVQIKEDEDGGLPLRDKLLILSAPYRSPLPSKGIFEDHLQLFLLPTYSHQYRANGSRLSEILLHLHRNCPIHIYSCVITTAVTVKTSRSRRIRHSVTIVNKLAS